MNTSIAYLLGGILIGLAIAWILETRRRNQAKQELDVERANVVSLKSDVARLETEVTHREAAITQHRADLDNVEQRFKAAFENLASQIFDQSAAKLKTENTNLLTPLLNPLREQITEFRQRVDAVHNADTSERSALRQQVQQLTELNQQVTTEAKKPHRRFNRSSTSPGCMGRTYSRDNPPKIRSPARFRIHGPFQF